MAADSLLHALLRHSLLLLLLLNLLKVQQLLQDSCYDATIFLVLSAEGGNVAGHGEDSSVPL